MDIEWHPIVVGGVFSRVNPSLYAQRGNLSPSKTEYFLKDIAEWAEFAAPALKESPVPQTAWLWPCQRSTLGKSAKKAIAFPTLSQNSASQRANMVESFLP